MSINCTLVPIKAKKASKKVTAKSIIENGIKSGWTIARISKAVMKAKPNREFKEQVVRIYASTMFKNKEINAEQKDKYLIRKKANKNKVVVKKKAAPKKKVAKKKAVKKK